MNYNEKDIRALENNFELLRKIVRHTQVDLFTKNLSTIEQLIKTDISEKLKHNAPPDFHVTYTNFVAAFDAFKNFFIYDKLIGKKVIALGGGFSSGKSSFLNAYMKQNILPSDINPSTSVPTYIIQGDHHQVDAINIFNAKLSLELPDIRRIAHGFDKRNSINQEEDIVTLGHILKSVFFSTSFMTYENIAFLDTPGYSKPDKSDSAELTDEIIARQQLNSSQYILWFIQADAGTITEEDVKFIKTLRADIPKLFILSKSDKKTESELLAIKEKIKEVLLIKGISFVDILSFSNKSLDNYDGVEILQYFQDWNNTNANYQYATNFKRLFLSCKLFYEEKVEQLNYKLHHINKVRLLSEDTEIINCFDSLLHDITIELENYRKASKDVKELQHLFFTELKLISDAVGVSMPEPSEIDLLEEQLDDPHALFMQFTKAKNITIDPKLTSIISHTMKDISPAMNASITEKLAVESLVKIILNNRPTDKIRLNQDTMINQSLLPILKIN